MNIIYLHGFQSSALSIKGQQLNHYCQQYPAYKVHLPDLNMPPQQVFDAISSLIEQFDDVVLVGSSLGGFYATQLVAKYGVPAVLINPAMRPWQLFRDLFGVEQIPYKVNEHWTLDDAQLDHLERIAVPFVQDADKILVLLQQGDEVLDYREAQRYYSAAAHTSLIMIEMHGNHAMENFADKIPMLLEFLSYSLK
ncbi:YqiA/YcfP family alpha/beta fold hydrolase [Acinetobacter sp. ANC 4648]|uniref:YqiA/YcfP family alpha/beta fold hydrolase n=1 Tax=Acinetobacter sp. ANC 4648 TaxID=1977875 RepID=UPI000A351C25|nr:YqiA/YcfP family alpha/beta fold hydrolase [Acinetobacter sp. ANC 4648]OTG85040.1 esterase [Acinetobacter sp. ANC 4648]